MTDDSKQPLIVWWIIWGAFLTGVLVTYHFVGNTVAQPRAPSGESLVWLAGIAPLILATLIRWLVLPRVDAAQTAFTLFVLGMAMAETTSFLGIFVFQAHKQELFISGALGIGQFVPLFARRFVA